MFGRRCNVYWNGTANQHNKSENTSKHIHQPHRSKSQPQRVMMVANNNTSGTSSNSRNDCNHHENVKTEDDDEAADNNQMDERHAKNQMWITLMRTVPTVVVRIGLP